MFAENTSYLMAGISFAMTLVIKPIIAFSYYLATLIPFIVLASIPGDKNENQFGQPQEN